jgi:predicted short-subunit dehydrogenase-like oxidoreductase (DUF2520 family)
MGSHDKGGEARDFQAPDVQTLDFQTLGWAIVGAGRVGKTLGLLANRLNIPIESTWNRGEAAAARTADLLAPKFASHGALVDSAAALVEDADIIWLTVVDSSISDAARALASVARPDQIVLHTAGSLSSEVLREANIISKSGSLHPLQAITDPQQALERLAEVAWTVEGDAPAVDYATWLMANIGVEPVEIDSSKKTLYHASAVTSANLLVALMDAAFAMAEGAGMSREQARAMMLPLARSSVENLQCQDTREALSGPAARGDQETIDRHVAALETLGEDELVTIYEVLMARAKGLKDRE